MIIEKRIGRRIQFNAKDIEADSCFAPPRCGDYIESQLTLYSMATLVGALLVYFDVYDQSDVIIVGNRTELISESRIPTSPEI